MQPRDRGDRGSRAAVGGADAAGLPGRGAARGARRSTGAAATRRPTRRCWSRRRAARVLIHPAPAENLKVTTPLDLRLAELLLAERAASSAQSRSRTQTSIAAKQSWPTPRAMPRLIAPSSSAIAGAGRRRRAARKSELTAHCGAKSRLGPDADRLPPAPAPRRGRTRRPSATSPPRTSSATSPPPRRPGSRSSASPSTSTASARRSTSGATRSGTEQAVDDLDAYCEFVRGDAAAARDRVRLRPRRRGPHRGAARGARLRLRRRLGPLRRRRRRAVDHEGFDVWERRRRPRRGLAPLLRGARRVRPLRPLRHPRPPRPGQGLGQRPAAARARPARLLRARGRGDRRERDRGRGLDRRACASRSASSTRRRAFAEMCVEAGAAFALSSDAHLPEQVGFGYDRALEFLDELGVERDLRLRAARSGASSRSAPRSARIDR